MKSTFGLTAVLCAFAAASVAQAQTKITYGTYMPAGHVVNTSGVLPLVERLRANDNHKVEIELFLGGVVAKASAGIDSVRDRVVDAGLVLDSFVPKQLPHGNLITDLTLLGRNHVVMSGAVSEFILVECVECRNDYRKNNVITMAHFSSSPQTIMCNAPINSMADLRGKRIRSRGAWSSMFSEMRMTPLNLGGDEAFEAIQRGQADCNIGPISWFHTYSLWDVAKHVIDTEIGTYHGGSAWIINADVWKGLKPEAQAVIRQNMPRLSADIVWGYTNEDQLVRRESEKKGITFYKPSADFLAFYEQYRLKEVDRIKKVGKERGIKNADQLVDRFIAIMTKWEKLNETEIKGDKAKYVAVLEREVYSKVDWK